MEIVFHSHHATASDRMRVRAEQGLRRLGRRLHGAVAATIRFDQDGPVRTVELALHAPGRRHLIATSSDRFWGPAIAAALKQLETQIASARRTRKDVGRRGRAERKALDA